jgi:hypothetical protein
MYTNATFQRIYWQALKDIVDGPMVSTNVGPVMDAKYNAFMANELFAIRSPDSTKSWITTRRAYLQQLLSTVATNFAITSNSGKDFSTNQGVVTLEGTAPIAVRTLRVNGLAYPVNWQADTAGRPVIWRMRLPLSSVSNDFTVRGYDSHGQWLTNALATIRIGYTGLLELAQEHVVINEIMYAPASTNGQYVELYNTSGASSFDLSGVRFSGLGYEFPAGTLIRPREYMVLAQNRVGFAAAYGAGIAVVGEYGGNLRFGGETLRLIRPGVEGGQEVIIDEVSYQNEAPWPVMVAGGGASLQLIDPLQDNNRVGNWRAGFGQFAYTPGSANTVRSVLGAFPPVWLNEVLPENVRSGVDGMGEYDPWVELYNGGTNEIWLGGFYLSDTYTNLTKWAFPTNASIGAGGYMVVWVDGEPGQRLTNELHTSFRLGPSNGVVVLSSSQNPQVKVLDYLNYRQVRAGYSYGSLPEGQVGGRQVLGLPTPGGANRVSAAPVRVYINEWMASNRGGLADPVDQDFEDWFELYNAETNVVELGGYSFANNLTNGGPWVIPAGVVIEPGGYLLVWADNEPGQNSVTNGDLHVDFRLSQGGEAIGLYGPDGGMIDGVSFGSQTTDVSQGRWPDGHGEPYYTMRRATPRAANVGPVGVEAPEIKGIAVIGGEVRLSWSAVIGQRYRVEYKDDLNGAGWSNLGEVTAADSLASMTDAGSATSMQRYYRVLRIDYP